MAVQPAAEHGVELLGEGQGERGVGLKRGHARDDALPGIASVNYDTLTPPARTRSPAARRGPPPTRSESRAPQPFELVPVVSDALPALGRQGDVRVGLLAHEALLDRDEPGVLELGQMAGEIALGQPSGALQEDEVGVVDRREHGQDGQTPGLVDEAVEDQLLSELRHRRSRSR